MQTAGIFSSSPKPGTQGFALQLAAADGTVLQTLQLSPTASGHTFTGLQPATNYSAIVRAAPDGIPAPEGVYAYTLHTPAGQLRSGTVTLER